jgi:hypothetical protein
MTVLVNKVKSEKRDERTLGRVKRIADTVKEEE